MEKRIDTRVINHFMKLNILFLFLPLIYLQCQPSTKEASSDKSTDETQNVLNGIELEEKEFIGKVDTGENEWFIMAGKGCKDCDENTSLYLFPKKGFAGSDSIEHTRYSFPGKLHSFDDEVIFDARVFYGECIPNFKKVVVWIQKQQTEDGKWKESVYVIELFDQSISEKKLDENLLKDILSKVQESKCLEVPGRDQTTEP
jgi:hypothetical protein